MNKREFLRLVSAAPLAAGRAFAQNARRPNFVIFLSDDHGYLDSPVYGSRVVKTPAMERLAAAGVVFTNTFAGSPSCAPNRAVLMSGLMSARNGLEPNHSQLKPDVRTLPSYLKELGYRVASFGKSHFHPPSSYADMEFVPSTIQGGPLNNDLDTAAVGKWLAARDPQDSRPLCLIVCSHSPHVYWPPNDGYDPQRVELPPTFVDTPETRKQRTEYYTDITLMDRQLGEVHDFVRSHLGRNTLFIYTSDNGAQWPFAKWNLYDAGIRMPMIASWPGVLKAGGRVDAMISFTDFLPTLIELAGGRSPAELDGRSFAAVLEGRTKRHRPHVFGTHSGDGNMNVYPMRSVRTDRFHYILNLHPEYEFTTHFDRAGARDGRQTWDSWVEKAKTDPQAAAVIQRYHVRPREELYDAEADPHETVNLAAHPEHRERLSQMRRQVEEWMQAQGDGGRTFGAPRPL